MILAKNISESCEDVPCELGIYCNSVNSIHDHNGLCFHAGLFNSCYLLYFESVHSSAIFVFVYAMFWLIWWCFYQLVLHFQLRFTHFTMFTCRFYSSDTLETSTSSVWICSLVSSTFICCYCQRTTVLCLHK